MHVFFSGIGGAGANSLALLAKQAGHSVSGSDAKASSTIEYLRKKGIEDVYIGQTGQAISKLHKDRPIDRFVYTSALPMTNPNHPELKFCQQNNIPALKHDEFLAGFIKEQDLDLIAIAGTHGKSTTTAMAVWTMKELGLAASWSVGAKMAFADTGHYEPGSKYFICEADEFDKKFLNLFPKMALISGIDWDHPDIYPTRESYYQAFAEFLEQSESKVLWQDDMERLGLFAKPSFCVLEKTDPAIERRISLPGLVNRQNAWLVANGLEQITGKPLSELTARLNNFPGLSRRFEEIIPNLYSDYAHTPPKIRGALQLAHEVAKDSDVVVVYEGLHNTRQHFIKNELKDLFNDIKHLYIVPSYLAREDKSLKLLSPDDLKKLLSPQIQTRTTACEINEDLSRIIRSHLADGDLVLCLSAGGADSLDEWLRAQFT